MLRELASGEIDTHTATVYGDPTSWSSTSVLSVAHGGFDLGGITQTEWVMIAIYGFAAVFFIYVLIITVVKRELRKEMRYLAMTKPKPLREKNGRFKKIAF